MLQKQQVHCSRRHVLDCYRRHVLVATDNKLNALCTRIHLAQILAVIMQSKRPGLERVGGTPRHRSSASAVQPAIFRNIMTDPVNELAPEQIWTIKPSHHQPPSTEFELTNTRPMRLPFAIDLVIGGKIHACLYIGHGQSKVVYRVTDEATVLKLTATKNHEPHVCQQLSFYCSAAKPALKICPTIYTIGRCQEQDQGGRSIGEWFAWLAEYATPLDKYMQRRSVDRKACLKIALYKQVIAAQHGLLLSDNNLFNFGVVDNTVVIIDIGSRCLQPHAIPKSTMNTTAIKKWWHRLVRQCRPGEHEECCAIWQRSTSLDEVAQQLCNTHLRPLSTGPVIDSVEQPGVAITDGESDVDRRSESGADFDASESDATTSLVTDEPQWNESEDDDAARSLIDRLSNQLDGEHGPPANADDIHLLIRFLWFGKQFQFNEIDAYQRGQTRLASILAEVRWIRDRFSSDANPAGNRVLSKDEVAKIHNQYRNSMCWMPGQVWEKYSALLDAAGHEAKGRSKGKRNWKRKGKRPVSFSQRAHQFRRQTFNVYFFKLFGSKALFFHLVKTGARNISIQDLLQQWTTFKTSDEYSKLIQCSAEKSAAEIELKSKRDRLRFDVLKKRNQGASEEVLMQLERELQEATDAYAATGRAGKRRGVAHHLM